MEPISLILAALVAGATAAAKDTAGKAVKDAYEGLKTLIKRKFEGDPVGQVMVDAKPEEIKQAEALLKDKITNTDADKDEEIIKKAESLLKQLTPEEAATIIQNYNISGDVKGILGNVSGGKIDFHNIS